jgi:hypothetical protein
MSHAWRWPASETLRKTGNALIEQNFSALAHRRTSAN